jgi:hypothetical protein
LILSRHPLRNCVNVEKPLSRRPLGNSKIEIILRKNAIKIALKVGTSRFLHVLAESNKYIETKIRGTIFIDAAIPSSNELNKILFLTNKKEDKIINPTVNNSKFAVVRENTNG